MRAIMRTTGVIYLCDRIGEIIDGKQYENPSMRRNIIDNWKKLYAAMYKTCYLQISPTVNAQFVDRRGLNSKIPHNLNSRGIDGKYLAAQPKIKGMKRERVGLKETHTSTVIIRVN
jgi:hypothetical protein